MSEQKQQIYEFDNFRLDVPNRELMRDGNAVALPGKAFDMLVVLIENGGRLVGKDDLFSRVWPDQIVEESNLTVQVSAIRKALGERKENPHYITTVSGHGYRFTGKLISLDEKEEEVVVERHSISRLAIESESAAGADQNALVKNFSTQNSLTASSEVETLKGSRTLGWRTPLVGGLLAIAISVGVFLVLKRTRLNEPALSTPVKSIAVLPLKPLVLGSRDESLELGMAETLIMRLSSLPEIKVPPMSAVRKYSGLEQDAVAAGRELQVESVLDGNIQRADDRLRVTMRLVRVADGQTLWTEHFDQNFTEIFAVQDRVAERLVEALAIRLSGEQRELLVKRHTNNPLAYALFLKGLYPSGTEEEKRKKSLEYFQQAVNLDPTYAYAHERVANSYIQLGSWGLLSPHETFPKAEAAVRKALELDEKLSDAHVTLAAYKMNYEWNWPEAEREIKRGIELDPKNDGAHSRYGSYFIKMGRFDEAIAMRKLARDLAPPSAFAVIANVGDPYYYARRYDEAIEHYQKALVLNPRFPRSHLWIGLTYVQMGKHDAAVDAIKQAITFSGGNTIHIAALGYAYAAAGKRAEARKVIDQLERLSKGKYISPYFFAIIYAGLGERDQTFAWLEKAFQERHQLMTLIGVEPLFDSVRSDPRFADLKRRVGLSS